MHGNACRKSIAATSFKRGFIGKFKLLLLPTLLCPVLTWIYCCGMALPVDSSANNDLSIKGLTAELIIGPDHEGLQEASDREIDDGEDEDEGVYFVQLGEEILQVGRLQKRKARSQMEGIAIKRAPPTCSRCSAAGHRSSNKKCPGMQAQVV